MFKVTSVLLKTIVLCGLQLVCFGETLTVEELCSAVPAGSFMLKPNTCNKWVRCPVVPGKNVYEEGICVNGLYYNKDTGVCEQMSKVKCPYNEKPNVNRCANQKDEIFLPDETNCKGYIYCYKGEEKAAVCPNNLVFNADTLTCVYENDYVCKTQSEGKNPICKSISNKTPFAHPKDCSKYQICSNDIAQEMECKYDEGFDHIKGVCVPVQEATCIPGSKKPEPENLFCGTKKNPKRGYYSDGVSCSGYYICGEIQADGTPDRKPAHLHCENGYFFDSKLLSCRNRLNVKCPYDRCEGMGNKYVNVAGDCTKYARCQNGAKTGEGKCPAEHFFDEVLQGCNPNIVNYTACSAQ